MLRAIMALLFAFLFLVVGIPVLGIEWLYGKINKKGAELSSLRIVQWAFSTIIGICGTDVSSRAQKISLPRKPSSMLATTVASLMS